MELELGKKVEVDEEVLQYLAETAVAHGLFIQTLLGIEEHRFPGFSQVVMDQLDVTLGKRASEPPERGWVNIRERVRDDLAAAIEGAKAESSPPKRRLLRQWLFGWPWQPRA